ncbi:MAG: FecR domain-containing protein [Bacteroidetes bacterium]|nr:FecR domain-containing protein [Bacteroidota bacterium]MCB0844647.1 FecR domain-containing protein [Bacteroidota bacterium]
MIPEKYKDYLAPDFASDEDFIRWVLNNQPVDKTFWDKLISEKPEKKKEIDQARKLITRSRDILSTPQFSQEEKEQMHQKLADAIHNTKSIKGYIGRAPVWVRWAAVIFILAAGGITFLFIQESQPSFKYETEFGQIHTLTLPDSSLVRLNANSCLTIGSDWNGQQDRHVWLEGEGYFEVKKLPLTRARFFVHTNDLVIQVLGTRFNVNSRNSQTSVVLDEGQIKLAFKGRDEEVIMEDPGDKIDYESTTHRVTQLKVNSKIHNSWKEGIQLFEKISLIKIIEKMEEIYGVRIQVKNTSLLERNLTMGIPVEDLNIALATIESVLGLRIVQLNEHEFMIE